jgi:hypothetical protein
MKRTISYGEILTGSTGEGLRKVPPSRLDDDTGTRTRQQGSATGKLHHPATRNLFPISAFKAYSMSIATIAIMSCHVWEVS